MESLAATTSRSRRRWLVLLAAVAVAAVAAVGIGIGVGVGAKHQQQPQQKQQPPADKWSRHQLQWTEARAARDALRLRQLGFGGAGANGASGGSVMVMQRSTAWDAADKADAADGADAADAGAPSNKASGGGGGSGGKQQKKPPGRGGAKAKPNARNHRGGAKQQAPKAPPKVARGRPSIVVVGDGLTESGFSFNLQGWGSRLVGAYIRKADVVNRGFGGFMSDWLKDYMLDELFDVKSPVMGILFLGVKDSQLPAAAGKAYTPPARFAANVEAIVNAGKAAGVKRWLVITPPPVFERPGKPMARTNANSRLYVEQLRALSKRHGAAFLDIFDAWAKEPGWADKYLNADKLHLSANGNARLFADVMATIKRDLPDMDPLAMAWQFPPMDAIDKADPAPAFKNLQ